MVKRFFIYGLTASAAISLIYLLIIKMVAGVPAVAPKFFYLWALAALPVLINGLLLFKYFISYRAIFLLLALAIFVSPLFFNLEHLDDEMRRSSFVFNGLAKPFTMRLSSNYELIFQPSGQGEREFIEANLTLILYREGVVPDQPLDAAQQEALREKLLAQAIGSRMFLFQKLQLLWDERKGYRLGTYQLAAILEKKFIAPSDGAEAPAAAGDEEVISED